MISKDKQYRTRDGREVRIYATDGQSNFPVHGAVNLGGQWFGHEWTKHGMATFKEQCVTDFDLIEVKPRHKRTVWLNVYPVGVYTWDTKEQADWSPAPERIACIKVDLDFEEGEGL